MEPVDVSVVHFEAEDGTRLEGDLLAPAEASGTAVVCHPHPLYGGSRQDAVVAALTRAFVGCGRRVLRFDFRGTGGSQGTHDGGGAERSDLLAAIEAVDPGTGPLTIAGYSFGADIALSVVHPAAAGWIVVAPPLAIITPEDMPASTDGRPVTVITGEHDQFNSPPQLRSRLDGWANAELHVIDTADHFFAGSHQALSEIATAAIGA
ncbi:MAG: alpha/beta family hydrolase [Acidimicrobiales bacterium]|nr:alpha/beta family hydrolase [Acidimicrobiales bacterium]